MAMLYFEDGSKEMILNPEVDFRRVIEERLGKGSADLFEEIIGDAEHYGFTEAEKFLQTIIGDIKSLIDRMKVSDCNCTFTDDLREIHKKIDEYDVWDFYD